MAIYFSHPIKVFIGGRGSRRGGGIKEKDVCSGMLGGGMGSSIYL